MTREVEALARHRLGRAREAMAEGEHLLSANSPTGAVNRDHSRDGFLCEAGELL